MQFTKDQRAAIDHEGSALLVSAAAGSGKTAVLVERAARLLVRDKDPVPADKLLIVTFTRAAAASLRAKLAARLAEEQLKHPGSAWLRRQRMLLQRASIGTIDSFCLQLVQTHFGKLDIPPDFSTADGPQLARLRAEALAAALENAYTDPDFCAFADLYGKGRSDKQAARVLEQLYDFLSSMPFPDASLDKLAADWAADLPLDATASNFGKADGNASPEDIASGIIHMVLQSIGQAAILSALNSPIRDFVLIGNLTQLPQCKEIFPKLEEMYGVRFLIPKYSEYRTAIGAALTYMDGAPIHPIK